MEFLAKKVHLPGPIYRFLPALYVVAAIVLFAGVDHMVASLASIALLMFAANISLKRLAAR